MRKLVSLLLVLALALGMTIPATLAEEAETFALAGDWYVEHLGVPMYFFIYDDGNYESMAAVEGSEAVAGTWAYDGEALTLTDVNGETLTLTWDEASQALVGEDDGQPVMFIRPIEPEEGEAEPEAIEPEVRHAAEDPTITDDVMALFSQAMEGLVGVNYIPVVYLGTNIDENIHEILCQATVVYPGAEPSWVIVYIYAAPDGTVTVDNVTDLIW